MVRRRWPAVVFGWSFWLLVGCGPAGPRLVPVSGQVTHRDKPVAEAMVVFHAVADKSQTQKPFAVTDSEGKFSLTTHKANDGAEEGEYRVTVELRDKVKVGEEFLRNGRQLLPTKYLKPDTSGLRHRVEVGKNEPAKLVLQ